MITSTLKQNLITQLRKLEKYTKTDMVYLFESGFWLNSGTLISFVLSFLLSIVFANFLPKEVFGTYQYILSFSSIIGALTLTGMNYAITRSVAQGNEGVLRIAVSTQLRWCFLPFIASLLLATYYALQNNYTLMSGLLIIGIFIPITNTFNSYGAYLNGLKKFKALFFANMTINFVYYPAIIAGVIFVPQPAILIFINLGANAIVAWYLYRHTIKNFPPEGNSDDDALSYGKRLSLTNVPAIIANHLDKVLVFHFLGATQLAIYAIATAIPEKLTGLFKFIFFASIPKYAVQNADKIAMSINKKMLHIGAVATILSALLAISANALFHALFPLYLDAVPYTQIYALIIITAAGFLPLSALISEARSNVYVYNIVGPIVQIALQMAFIILWGLWGIIVARLLSGAFNIILAQQLVSRNARNY